MFDKLPNPKQPGDFRKLVRLPVRTPTECALPLAEIIKACRLCPENRAIAGPTTLRGVCAWRADGIITGHITRLWCRAVLGLLGDETNELNLHAVCSVNVATFVAIGGVDLLLSTQKDFIDDEFVPFWIPMCATLLARASPEAHHKLLTGGILKSMYASMAIQLASEKIQKDSLLAILELIRGPPASAAVPQAASQATWACSTLLRLPIRGDLMDAFVFSGGLARVYAAMDAHPSSVSIQSSALNVLALLASSNSLRIITSCGLDRIYGGLRNHPGSIELLFAACMCFGLLGAMEEESKLAIVSTGGLDLIRNAMIAHPASPDVQRAACSAVGSILSGTVDSRITTPCSGTLDQVCSSLASHPTSADVQELGLAALANMAAVSGNVERMKAIRVRAPALLARKALANHSTNHGIRQHAESLLRSLA